MCIVQLGRVAYLVLRGDVGTTVDPAVVLGYVCTDACELATVIKVYRVSLGIESF